MVDLRDAVKGMLPLLEKSLQGSYAIALELAPEPCPVLVDVADLELALLNLLTNARDAMPDGGSIRVSVAPSRAAPVPPAGSSWACTTPGAACCPRCSNARSSRSIPPRASARAPGSA